MRGSKFSLACVIFLAAGFVAKWAAAAPTYKLSVFEDLSPDPLQEAHAYSINASGQVAGYGYVGADDHVWLWTPGVANGTTGSVTDLGNPPNNMVFTQAMNDYGQVAGMHNLASPLLLWTPSTPRGNTGHVTDLGDLPTGHNDTFTYGINGYGQIAGQSNVAGKARAFLWTPNSPNGAVGAFLDLGDLPGTFNQSTAKAINARGQVTGASIKSAAPFGAHAFVWSPTTPNGTSGSMVDIGDLPGGEEYGVGMGINATGQVVGYGAAAAGRRAFLWTPSVPNGDSGTMINLGTLPGDDASTATAINRFGFVVGNSSFNNNPYATHGFLWTAAGGMIDLNSLLDQDYPGWTIYSGDSINDYGQITGEAIYDPDGPGGVEGYPRPYLLTPAAPLQEPAIPEPGMMGMVAFGAAMLSRRSGYGSKGAAEKRRG